MTQRLAARRWPLATLLSLGLAASTLGAQPASADATTDAPVTMPDRVTLWAGSTKPVDVLANDVDPQADSLAVCRVGESSHQEVDLAINRGELFVFASPLAKAGTYELTYYACDFEYLTPGTVTVTVKRAKRVRVTKLDGLPGKLRLANPNPRNVVVMWGNRNEAEPDGTLRLPAHKAQVITVSRRQIFWIAYFPRDFVFVGMGTVRDITLPRRVPSHRVAPMSSRMARLWASHR